MKRKIFFIETIKNVEFLIYNNNCKNEKIKYLIIIKRLFLCFRTRKRIVWLENNKTNQSYTDLKLYRWILI